MDRGPQVSNIQAGSGRKPVNFALLNELPDHQQNRQGAKYRNRERYAQ